MGVLPVDNLPAKLCVAAVLEAVHATAASLMRRLERLPAVDQRAILTSVDPVDDIIAEFAHAHDIVVIRTPENDLLSGYARAAECLGADIVVRLGEGAPEPAAISRLIGAVEGFDCVATDEKHPAIVVMTRLALDKLLMDVADDPLARRDVIGYFRTHPGFVAMLTVRADALQRTDAAAFLEILHARLEAQNGHSSLAELKFVLQHEKGRRPAGPGESGKALLHVGGGAGHAKPMIALARALRDNEHIDCVFAAHSREALAAAKTAGFAAYAVAKLPAMVPSLVIVDGPLPVDLSQTGGAVTAVIGDASENRLAADFAYYPPLPQFGSLTWRGSRTQVRVGWEWALLGHVPAGARARPKSPRPTVLIAMGSSDPQNLTQRAAKALSVLDPVFRARFVIGPGVAEKSRRAKAIVGLSGDFQTIEGADGLATEFAACDMALITCGVAALEAAASGIPAIYLCCDETELMSAAALEKAGLGISLGLAASVSHQMISKAISDLLKDGPRRMAMRAAALTAVDGGGAVRIAAELAAALSGRGAQRAAG